RFRGGGGSGAAALAGGGWKGFSARARSPCASCRHLASGGLEPGRPPRLLDLGPDLLLLLANVRLEGGVELLHRLEPLGIRRIEVADRLDEPFSLLHLAVVPRLPVLQGPIALGVVRGGAVEIGLLFLLVLLELRAKLRPQGGPLGGGRCLDLLEGGLCLDVFLLQELNRLHSHPPTSRERR